MDDGIFFLFSENNSIVVVVVVFLFLFNFYQHDERVSLCFSTITMLFWMNEKTKQEKG